jgi:branched-chain amino acid transport system ATP-binding protein
MLLDIKNLNIYYGKAKAVEGVSLNVQEGEIVTIIGANGAGKSSILRTISGLKRAASGEIWFQDKRIDHMPPHRIVKMGISQIPPDRMIFTPMSVLDNLKTSAHLRKDQAKVKQDMELIYEHFPILKERHNQPAGQLSGGQQQMLAIACALMASPKLLLMDEPSSGLSPLLVAEMGTIIRDLNSQGLSILLVEQNCRMALKLAKRAYLLELGSLALSGYTTDLANNDRVKRLYLGGDAM